MSVVVALSSEKKYTALSGKVVQKKGKSVRDNAEK